MQLRIDLEGESGQKAIVAYDDFSLKDQVIKTSQITTVVWDWDHTLVTNPYVNEVTLRRQKPPLKCC